MKVRLTTIDDYEALCAVDSVAETSQERRDQISEWLLSARCHVAEADGRIAAYGVLTDHFFGHPFIEMVMVGKDFRHQGFATEIIRYLLSTNPSSKIFSSTNTSNRPMQMLFAKLGFKPTGYVDNLDEGDPEIIFYHPAA